MNVSPHHQRPTKYPFPGGASLAILLVALALLVLIGFMLIRAPATNDGEQSTPTGLRITARIGLVA